MQVDPQRYLDLVEKSGKLYMVDSESQGREADYGRLYVISVKPYGQDPTSFVIGENMQDKGMVVAARDMIDEADCIVTFYGKGFDVPMINTRLLRYGKLPLKPVHHIDMYFTLKPKIKTGSKSQAHLLEFLHDTMEAAGIPAEKKMTVAPNVWSDLPAFYHKNIRILRKRCESDTAGLESLYRAARHLIREIKVSG